MYIFKASTSEDHDSYTPPSQHKIESLWHKMINLKLIQFQFLTMTHHAIIVGSKSIEWLFTIDVHAVGHFH